MQPKFVRPTSRNDKLQDLSLSYDKFIRTLFRTLNLDCPPKEKLDLLREKYYEISNIHVEKNEALITRLQKLKEEIKMSRQSLNQNFVEAMKLLRSAEIIDVFTYKQLIDEPPVEEQIEPELKPLSKKEREKSAKKFLNDLICKKMDLQNRKMKDDKVNNVLGELKKIRFEELDAKLEVDFELYGSCCNGYSLRKSDYDISLITLEPVDERKILDFFYEKAKIVLKQFMGKDKFKITRLTHENIRIPLVEIKISSLSLPLSFTVNNILGVYNSKLLRTYAKFDDRCHMLGLLVKIWGNTHGLISAKKNFLSSYALNLMVINFLQTMKNPILPNLQGLSNKQLQIQVCRKVNNGNLDEFVTRIDFESDPEVLKNLKSQYSTNNLTDIKLLRKFFKFFSQESNFSGIRLSVKNGGQIPRSEEGEEMKYLYSIEDPFDLKNNPGRPLKAKTSQAEKMLQVMKKSYVLLKENKVQEVFQPFI